MSKSVVITARLGEETVIALDKLGASMERSRAWIVAKAIERYVEEEAEYLAFLQKGVDDLDAGRTITHEELVERIKARHKTRQAA